MTLFHLYRTPALSAFQTKALLDTVKQQVTPGIRGIETEHCFNIEASQTLDADEMRLLQWLLAETFEPEKFSDKSFLLNILCNPHRNFSFPLCDSTGL